MRYLLAFVCSALPCLRSTSCLWCTAAKHPAARISFDMHALGPSRVGTGSSSSSFFVVSSCLAGAIRHTSTQLWASGTVEALSLWSSRLPALIKKACRVSRWYLSF